MVLSAQELDTIQMMAGSGMGNQKIATTLALPQSTARLRIVLLKDTAQKHVIETRHLGTLHRHRQHLPSPNALPLILKWAPGPTLDSLKSKNGPRGSVFLSVPQVPENKASK